jgi:hypothetical protein
MDSKRGAKIRAKLPGVLGRGGRQERAAGSLIRQGEGGEGGDCSGYHSCSVLCAATDVTPEDESHLLHTWSSLCHVAVIPCFVAVVPTSPSSFLVLLLLTGGVPPPLTQLFSVGQYVRCVIKDLGSSSSSDTPAAANGSSSSSSSKKRVTATLRQKVLLPGVSAAAAADAGGGYFEVGQVVPAVVRSIEDRGYALDLGVKVSKQNGSV